VGSVGQIGGAGSGCKAACGSLEVYGQHLSGSRVGVPQVKAEWPIFTCW